MILFKCCPRCGGDVDAAAHDDARCVQCAHRPAVAFPGPVVVEPAHAAAPGRGPRLPDGGEDVCPRCGSDKTVRLEKLRPHDNACLRCRSCGHIFSPGPRTLRATQRDAV